MFLPHSHPARAVQMPHPFLCFVSSCPLCLTGDCICLLCAGYCVRGADRAKDAGQSLASGSVFFLMNSLSLTEQGKKKEAKRE